MEDYSRNLTSIWDTAEAFGASPGTHRGLVEGWLLAEPGRITEVNNITDIERTEAETQTSDAVKAALLISGADKVEDYSCNLTSLWDTAEAFGAFPGIHRGLVEGWLFSEPGRIADVNNITDIEQT